MRAGLIGGEIGYRLLRRFGRATAEGKGYCNGGVYSGTSKLETLLGRDVWNEIRGKSVLDFGCGTGDVTIAVAEHGARPVVGLEIRQKLIDKAKADAQAAGVADRCLFATSTEEHFDVVLSIDSFEHYDDPAGVLDAMHRLLRPGGKVLISFGPPWLHPFGGHLFSVFPWAHLVFTERSLIRWRQDFKTDGATRFNEVEGGLNQMTIHRFHRLIADSHFAVQTLELIPIRRLKRLFNPLTREFLTSVVRCTLVATP